MYRISYEKCVCFVFLVILAVLSCSGFRIDNIAMTDISKKNSHTSSSLGNPEFLDRLFNVEPAHRIRHHRQLRAPSHLDYRPTGHIDTVILPTKSYSPPSDQIPATLFPTRSVAIRRRSRSQRFSRSPRPHFCQEQDVTRKTYLANTVVLAKAMSMRTENIRRKENYTVLFKVLQRIKSTSFPVDDFVRLNFSSNKSAMNCETYNNEDVPKTLVKAKIEKSKEYILFLNTYAPHNYTVVGAPEVRKKKILNTISRIADPRFRSKEVKVERLERFENFHVSDNRHKRLKLVCKVRGFPIPYIHWKRNGTFLRSDYPHLRITYRKRKSTLVIKNLSARDWGHYQCLARGVDGSTASKEIRIIEPVKRRPTTSISSEKPASGVDCKGEMKRNYCLDGGTCFYLQSMGEYGCVCAEGYSGPRCEMKSSNQSSELDDSLTVSEKSF